MEIYKILYSPLPQERNFQEQSRSSKNYVEFRQKKFFGKKSDVNKKYSDETCLYEC